VGKSTLVNRLCKAEVAIVSPVPQTTRDTVRGVVNAPSGQLVFVDTPGRHLSDKAFNKRLVAEGEDAARDADMVLYVLDAEREPGPEEEDCAAFVAGLAPDFQKNAVAVAVNKIDAAKPDTALAFARAKLPLVNEARFFALSAKTGEGVDALLDGLFAMAPEGPAWYPLDVYTDQSVPFRVAEVVRGECFARLRDELPHALTVEVADCELRDEPGGGKRLFVRAFILVEKESQKGMVVGKGGALVKRIREASVRKLKELFDWHLELHLEVKCDPKWKGRRSPALL
jgi:GTP-binding protein Era